ncbi:MAG: DegV family protein [Anaerolineales bacterium]
MRRTCIVTDPTAQFPKHKAGWQEFVKVLPISFMEENLAPRSTQQTLPSLVDESYPLESHLSSGNDQKLKAFLAELAYEYQQVLFLLPTKTLFPSFELVTQTLQQMNLPTVFDIIDSRSLGYGLGWLVQTCSIVLAKRENFNEVKRLLYHKIPHIYTLTYLPNLSNLGCSKILDPDQAFIGDFLGIRPLVLLENDQIVPYQKTRSFKNVVDSIIEYADEFNRIEYVGLHFGNSIGINERKNLQSRLQSTLAQNTIDSQVMSPYLNRILGDQSISVVLIESDRKHEI